MRPFPFPRLKPDATIGLMSISAISKRGMRSAVFALLDAAGFPYLFLGTAPRILLYHGVTDETGDGIFNYRAKFVSTQAFRAHMEWVKKTFKVLPLAELIERSQAGTLPPRALAITFDDGYRNNYSDAYPILRELGLPATFFITTDFIEKPSPLPVDMIEYAIGKTMQPQITLEIGGEQKQFSLENRQARIAADMVLRKHMKTLPAERAQAFIEDIVRACGCDLRQAFDASPYCPMTWDQMREMEMNGMSFAPHTRTHPILSRLPREAAADEITGSKDVLRRELANPLSVFAYPNGGRDDYTQETIEILKAAGLNASLTTESRTLGPSESPYTLPRFTMDGANDMHRARLIISGVYSRLS